MERRIVVLWVDKVYLYGVLWYLKRGGFVKKVNISFDEELLQRIDDFADRNYMSRSGLISYAVTQYLNQSQVIDYIKDLSIAMRKIADTGKVDHETMEQLEDFERLSKFLVGKNDF